MKFQIGDKVVITHSNEEGEVIDIINEQMVMVEIRGVRFPAYMDQLDFPYFKRFTEKKLFPEKKEPKKYIDQIAKEKVITTNSNSSSNLPEGIWIMFLPRFTNDDFGDEVVDQLKVHLVNGTSTSYAFTYRLIYQGKESFELKNEILPKQNFYLHNIPFEEVNDTPTFEFEFALPIPDKRKADFYETALKLKPKQFFNKIEELKKNGLSTFSYQVMNDYPDKVFVDKRLDLSALTKGGYKVYEASKIREYLPPARTVIDLHIDKLTDNWERMDSFEMLTLQLEEFQKYYDLALAHRQSTLTVIHGIGSGKLKDEIHELLHHKKEVKHFVNRYHPSYGYGATEIYFQY